MSVNTIRATLTAVVAGLAITVSASAAPIYFDFGSNATSTPGNYNNIDHTQQPILNAVDTTGAATGIGLLIGGFNELGPNTNGTLAPAGAAAIFDPQATRDNLFGHSVNFNAPSPRPLGELELTGLDPLMAYNFTFFASRLGVTDNREAEYTVTGSNAGVGFLDASNNTSNVAIVSGVLPTGAGSIVISVKKGPNNTNGSGFFYLGALCVECVVPEPTSGMLLMFGAVGLGTCRRLFAVRRLS